MGGKGLVDGLGGLCSCWKVCVVGSWLMAAEGIVDGGRGMWHKVY